MGQKFILLLMGLALVFAMMFAPGRSFADAVPGDIAYRDMELAVLPVKKGQKYDMSIVSEAAGLTKIKAAIDYLYKISPYSKKQIQRLRQNGDVYVIYNPAYPYDMGAVNLKLAAFLPTLYDRTGKDPTKKDFVVFVGRYGIKRSTQVLARTIVHELVGHGIQHLEGRTEYVRVLDLECEARLFEEKFVQEAGLNKRDRDVIKFRKAMENHWCSDFKAHMAKHDPKLLKLWSVRNPNVPILLHHFRQYTQSVRKARSRKVGPRKVVKQTMQAQKDAVVTQLEADAGAGKPKAQYQLGVRYLNGDGVSRNAMTAATWFHKAADQNLVDAQYSYGIMLLEGQGMDADAKSAALWLSKAADQGFPSAQFAMGLLYLRGNGLPMDRDKATEYMRKAAEQDYAKAKMFLMESDTSN